MRLVQRELAVAAAAWCGISLAALAAPVPLFEERGGLVVIEAEHGTDNVGAWEEVEGRNATATHRGTTADVLLRLATGAHPFAGGMSGDVELPRGTMLPWGFAGEQAIVGWTLGHDPRKAAVFGYERGAAMPVGRAPARRVLAPAWQPDAPAALGTILDAAIRWAAAGEGKRVLVTNNQRDAVDEEKHLIARLEKLGFTVKVVPAEEARQEDAAGCALVVIPAPVRVEKIGTKFNELPVPIVTLKSHIAQFLGMVPPPKASRPGDNAMLIRAGAWTDHVRYVIHFPRAGEFYVWLLGQSGGSAGADEAKIFFVETPNVQSERFFEMKLPAVPGWVSAATARRPGNRKTPMPAIVTVRQPGWHALYLVKGAEPEQHGATSAETRRYPNWRVDKIVLARDPAWMPQGDDPDETRAAAGAPALPPELAPRREWRPRQVWSVSSGYVAIEAEEIDHHAHWQLRTEPAGASGRGYLEWRGPNRSKSIEDLGGNDDHLHVRQGPPEEWLILRLEVPVAGNYRIDVRNHHRLRDGDNDVWFARVGQRGTAEAPIRRLVDSHRDGTGFTWLDSAPPPLSLNAGLNELYIGGRSVGFGVDRIVFHAADDADARRRAVDPATAAARPSYVLAAVHDFQSANEPEFVPYYRDMRNPDPARHALAIDAKQHKRKFAAAQASFGGTEGTYDITLVTLTENDGESTYRVKVGARVIGEFQNPARTDGSPASQTWRGVELKPGDSVRVESNTHSNGRIPEAGEFAWARGRWTELRITPAR